MVDLEIVVAQCRVSSNDFANVDFGAFRFSLACEGKQILYDAMSALSLFEQLADIILARSFKPSLSSNCA